MKNISLLILLFSFNIFASQSFENFGKLPILHEGRVKPLDTFARINLLILYEKNKLKGMSAIQWLTEVLFDSENAYSKKIFRIRNKDVTNALSIIHRDSNLFSFYEVSFAVKNNLSTIYKFQKINSKIRTPSQQQIVDLYAKTMMFFDVSRSLTLLRPTLEIPHTFRKKLSLQGKQKLSYIDLIKRREDISKFASKIRESEIKSSSEQLFLILEKELNKIEHDQNSMYFKIIPPQFSNKEESDWFSPWQVLINGRGSPHTVDLFKNFKDLNEAYLNKNGEKWRSSISMITKIIYNMHSKLDRQRIEWEYAYNNWNLFIIALSCYIFAFILLSLSLLFKGNFLIKLCTSFLSLGAGVHLFGLIIRCYIMSRPPVTTLYESIIFVALVSVIGSLIYEFKKKDGIGNFIGTILGIIFLFISFGHEKDGDSMGMLSAVLNTNFWLATHVVTITIGYGCCFVASILGHVYLFQTFIDSKRSENKLDLIGLNKSMIGVTLYSLFFTILGTILGGIWADQSWGRFWGWDPKENGAMLICLWLLFLLHGRICGYFKPVHYAMGSVFTSIVVAFAWFGVNLLNVGLHSYGFTKNIANNLLIFTIIELVYIFTMYTLYTRRRFQ
jgi:ABC-type transport system involved in cytochrome c biogenesis permease subunit